MIALIRLFLLVFLAEAVFYLLLRLYLRSTRREALEQEYDRRHPDAAGDSPPRRVFVRRAMRGFDRSLKTRLIGAVFVIPTIAIMVIIYLVNWQ